MAELEFELKTVWLQSLCSESRDKSLKGKKTQGDLRELGVGATLNRGVRETNLKIWSQNLEVKFDLKLNR